MDGGKIAVRHGPVPQSGVTVERGSVVRVATDPKRPLRLRAVMTEGRAVDLGLTFYAVEQVDFVAARFAAALSASHAPGVTPSPT